jgi:glutathione synthase/RimK-type ligase-like ATP-grasp enzyme
MKKVLILYKANKPINKNKPFQTRNTQTQIEKLFIKGEEKGIKFYRAPLYSFDYKKKNFTKGWSFQNNKWIIVKNIIPDIIFDKATYDSSLIAVKNKISSIFLFVNSPAFDEMTSNKFTTYHLFKDYMPKSYLVHSKKDINKKINYLRDNKFVIKPITGAEGRAVKVIAKKDTKNIRIKEPMLLQSFIDSSKGINNIVSGYHDLRIIIFNNKIFGSYIRTPKQECLLANIAQGGKRIILDKNNIPPKALKIVKYVTKSFSSFDNLFYSVDFIFDKNQKPYILEINSRPGFSILSVDKEKSEKFFKDYFDRIIKFFSEIKIK